MDSASTATIAISGGPRAGITCSWVGSVVASFKSSCKRANGSKTQRRNARKKPIRSTVALIPAISKTTPSSQVNP